MHRSFSLDIFHQGQGLAAPVDVAEVFDAVAVVVEDGVAILTELRIEERHGARGLGDSSR